MNWRAPTVLIMAGGTGGHVFPGLAVADALAARGARVHWLGSRRGLEARVVPAAGIPLHYLRVAGLRGKSRLTQLRAMTDLFVAFWQALQLVWRLKPDCVLGLGGYVAGPGGIAAWLLRRPLLLHEQNAVPGTTNRLLARFARRILQGFPLAWGGAKALYVGNPVRAEISGLASPLQRIGQRDGALRLLVLGGSLGAQPINQVLPAALDQCPRGVEIEVWHQTGAGHDDVVATEYRRRGIEARVEPFISDMAAAYGWADLVLCRAGALTIAELAAVGVGALMVPLPHAIDDHQLANARWLEQQGGGQVLPQSELTAERLARELAALAADRPRLLTWAESARAAAPSDATATVCDEVWEVACG